MVQRERAKRGIEWVSKTDVMRYLRCPYAFQLLDRGEISFDDTVDEFQLGLMREGMEFQAQAEAAVIRADPAATRTEVSPADLPSVLRRDVTVLRVQLFENRKLKIYGQPDGVDAAGGAVVPIEIKSHKDLQRTDELELAFYWLLLEPYRKLKSAEPRGILFLRRSGGEERVEVGISERRLDETRTLIQDVRRARRRGVQPRVCGCRVCSVVKRDHVEAVTRRRRDLTLVYDIGRTIAPVLERMGVKDWSDLLASEASAIAERLRDFRLYRSAAQVVYRSAAQVERWKRHAESYQRQEPVFFGTPLPIGSSFVAIDLEYGARIWLAAACVVVENEPRKRLSLWADSAQQERESLRKLRDLIVAHPSMPIVTWAGKGADVPRLREAARQLRIKGLLEPLLERHVDLFQYAVSNLRLPIPGFSLKDVGEYFGARRFSDIRDGLEAQLRYREYRETRDRESRKALREQLLEYSRDDIDALLTATRRIKELGASAVKRSPLPA